MKKKIRIIGIYEEANHALDVLVRRVNWNNTTGVIRKQQLASWIIEEYRQQITKGQVEKLRYRALQAIWKGYEAPRGEA